MRILITNDDGIEAPGLHALARAVSEAGYPVLVVAPDRDHSGYGAALGDVGAGTDPHLRIAPARIPGAERVEAWSVAGPPALCVLAARLGGFGEAPDIVVSGVNPGHNTGRAVLHSGTVGAALTGANLGISGLAVSVAADADPRFDTAAAVAVAGLGWLVTSPTRTVLNLNVPGVDLADLRGTRWASLAPFGTVRSTLNPSGPDRLELTLVETAVELPADSDTALVRAGYVAATCLTGIRQAEWQPVAADLDRRLAVARRRHGRAPGETA